MGCTKCKFECSRLFSTLLTYRPSLGHMTQLHCSTANIHNSTATARCSSLLMQYALKNKYNNQTKRKEKNERPNDLEEGKIGRIKQKFIQSTNNYQPARSYRKPNEKFREEADREHIGQWVQSWGSPCCSRNLNLFSDISNKY